MLSVQNQRNKYINITLQSKFLHIKLRKQSTLTMYSFCFLHNITCSELPPFNPHLHQRRTKVLDLLRSATNLWSWTVNKYVKITLSLMEPEFQLWLIKWMADRLRFIFSLSRVAATLYQLITAAALSFAEPTNCAGNVFRDILHNTVFYLENVARTIANRRSCTLWNASAW